MPPRRTPIARSPESVQKGIKPVDLDEPDDEGKLAVFSGEVEDESDESDGGNEASGGRRPGRGKATGRGKGRGKGKGKGPPEEPTGKCPLHTPSVSADIFVVWLRTANYICFVKTGTVRMVKLTPEVAAGGCDLLGWMAPLSGGTRRATRAWLGYTPLWEQHTDQDVWYMDTRYARVHINSMPEWTSETVMRHR